MKRLILGAAVVGAGLWAMSPERAEACGCFAPPSPAEPVVQAGERIVFAHEDGKVVAHIQIQYQGDPSEFAWLLPVPNVPDLRLGTDELFTQIQAQTNPLFLLNQTGACGGGGPSIGCGADEALSAAAPNTAPPEDMGVAVEVSSAGPYDYAVVRADEKQPMIDWLNENRFFVPAGTADAMDPYIRPGSYFLALKLRAGESSGSLLPVILEYESDLPMIPIILTQVAAVNDMGVLVWVLGEDRAIPHNYQHVEINDEYIDWVNGAANYAEVVARAVDEAEGGHAFVTEYAGTTAGMIDLLDYQGRFGTRTQIENTRTLFELFQYVTRPAWPQAAVQGVLARHYPLPEAAIVAGVSSERYYADLPTMVDAYDPDRAFDPQAIADDLWERIVLPTLEAGQLFRNHPMMTRLYTALDPEEMSKDPVFAFNPDLPEVPRQRQATLERTCDDNLPFLMHLDDGRTFELGSLPAWNERVRDGAPRARLVQVIRQEGAPETIVDNRALLADLADAEASGGCQSTARDRSGALTLMMMFLLVGVGRRAMRRR